MRIREPILRASVAQFGIGHLVFNERDSEKREKYWSHDTGTTWLCGYRMPPFQRATVWTTDQRVRFIESAWLGFHLGTYVVNRNDSWSGGKPHRTDLWLIDGQQRLRAIESYITSHFPVFGYYWHSLDLVEQRRFENVPFAQSTVHLGDEAVLRELYDRLNFGGTPHTEDQRAT